MVRAGRKAERSGDRGFSIIQHPYISRFSDLDKGDLERWGRIVGELRVLLLFLVRSRSYGLKDLSVSLDGLCGAGNRAFAAGGNCLCRCSRWTWICEKLCLRFGFHSPSGCNELNKKISLG